MKVLVYDGDCSMCRGLSRLLVRPCLTGDTVRRPLDDFDEGMTIRLYEAQIHNEMAVLDRESGEIRSGFAGILWVLRKGALGWLAWLLALPGIRHVMAFLYRLVAYNRRILSPVRARQVACACDPDPRPLYQGTLIALCLALASLFQPPIALCLAVVVLLLPLLRDRRTVPSATLVSGHLAWITVLGMAVFLLLVLTSNALGPELLWVLGAVLGFLTVTLLVARRASQLGFGALGCVVTPFALLGAVLAGIELLRWIDRLPR